MKAIELNEFEQEVLISGEDVKLNGILGLPKNPSACILFAHGSGSGRYSPRNNFVSRKLQEVGCATLLMDLLTDVEASDRDKVFDLELLAERLNLAKYWLSKREDFNFSKIGYFGASTGAGAALVAAARNPKDIYAIVSRGGRPDLAGPFLEEVKAPTLFLVGGLDDVVIDLNKQALEKMTCTKQLKIIPGATHLFEESGTLEKVAILAADWFVKHLHSKH